MSRETDFDRKLKSYKDKVDEALAAAAEIQKDILVREDGAMEYRKEYRAKLLETVVTLHALREDLN